MWLKVLHVSMQHGVVVAPAVHFWFLLVLGFGVCELGDFCLLFLLLLFLLSGPPGLTPFLCEFVASVALFFVQCKAVSFTVGKSTGCALLVHFVLALQTVFFVLDVGVECGTNTAVK